MKVINKRETQNFHLITNSKISKDANSLKKEVVLFIVRRSLLETGTEPFEMVERSMFEKYHCDISDCFEKPEYLADVLKYVYDGSYATVIESIMQKSDNFVLDVEVKEFIEKITQK